VCNWKENKKLVFLGNYWDKMSSSLTPQTIQTALGMIVKVKMGGGIKLKIERQGNNWR